MTTTLGRRAAARRNLPQRRVWAMASSALLLLSGPLSGIAEAQRSQATDDSEPDKRESQLLSLDPSSPSAGPLAGGLRPAMGAKSASAGDWRYDVHGFFTMPMVVGLNSRTDPGPGEHKLVLHTPPVVPGDLETFSHTGVTPTPYAQLNFSYGNSLVTANVQLLARQASVSSGFFDPPSQAGINDAYLTVTPDLGSKNVSLKIHTGAFSNRYGLSGEFDQGRYGTPLIFRTNGVGENIIAKLRLGPELVLALEQGIQSQSSKAPASLTPDLWNDFADPNAGSSFINHVHVGANYAQLATLGLHYAAAFSRDDRATGTLQPDGNIDILGADLRLSMGRFGHLYIAGSQVKAENASTVGRIVEVLNTRGGGGLIDNYLGDQSEGNGQLKIVGAQYDLSIGRLVSYPVPFYGDGPDIVVSLYGMGVRVKSDDDRANKVDKMKVGAEASYSLLSWLAASLRYDQVNPNLSESRYAYAVISPRVIFHTDWQSTDQVTLQYSKFVHGSLTTTRTGAPPRVDPLVVPDGDVLSLSASIWW